jgi:hypothetical protein
MSLYGDRLKKHLANYKRDQLLIAEHGKWRGNNQPYDHILPESRQKENILPCMRDEFWAYFEKNRGRLSLHTDFHHLNSSQAFAFNLFFRWLNAFEKHAALLSALGVPEGAIDTWSFEDMPDQSELTVFDVRLLLADGRQVLVETKLTEEHFGIVNPKASHRVKRTEIYLKRLEGKANANMLTEEVFFLNYQLLRNLSHLELARGDRLVLLLPRANALTWQQALRFRDALPPAAAAAVSVLAVEDIVATLSSSIAFAGDADLATWHAEFATKYLPRL